MLRNWPGRREWLFSAATFAAALLALFTAFWLGLERPYWAATTCYITAQGSAGALNAKALWRFGGTLAGGAFAVAALPAFANAPPLLALAFALWVGLCLTASLLDPSPRSYGFMLAGYTAGIIAFPTVATPEAIFTTALLRVEEISLGILCAWLMHRLLLPASGAPLLRQQVDAWAQDIARLAEDALAGIRRADAMVADRRRLARDGAALDARILQGRYEAGGRAEAARLGTMRALGRQVLVLVTAAADRLAQLPAPGPLPAEVAAWMAEGGDPAPLLARLRAAEATAARQAGWPALVAEGLHARLQELVTRWAECRAAAEGIGPGPARPMPWRVPGHADPLLLGLSGLSAMAAVLACCAFWWATAWPGGATLAMMAAVGTSIFAQLDDPAPAIARFLAGTALAAVVAGLYLFAVLPAIDGFPLLAFALGLFYLPVGAFMAVPALMPAVTPLVLNTTALMALQETYSASFPAFVESALGILGGIGAALVVTRLLRGFGVAWRVARLLAADRRDLVRLAQGQRAELPRIAATMLDRFEALAARLGEADAVVLGARELTTLRAAFNLLRLRDALPTLPPPARDAAAALLPALALEAPPEALLPLLDRALALTAAEPRARAAAQALSGLRMALAPGALPPVLSQPLPMEASV